MTKILLWIDDMRNPHSDNWLMRYAPSFVYEGKVVWVKNYQEFVDWVTTNGLPDTICFDNDLKLPYFNSQSANTVGRENILTLLRNHNKHVE